MINTKENKIINEKLLDLYKKHTNEYLREWTNAFYEDKEGSPGRINEFGIIDENKYDSDKGILFICRETNGWKNEDYAKGSLFRTWMQDIADKGLANRGHITTHPNMWYNIGRWTLLLQSPNTSLDKLVWEKEAAIAALGTIAFTNINKVRGENASRKEYNKLAYTQIAQELLRQEIAIINPKTIVCCGTWGPVSNVLGDYDGNVFRMYHPGARKSTKGMLQELKEQIELT